MELRHLRYFVAVATERNFSRAAAALHIAQPALSRQIRDLERELDVVLLTRHAKGVAPTLAGETCAREAAHILASIADALDRAEAAGSGFTGRVVMGATRAAIARGLPADVQERMRCEHGDIDLLVQELELPHAWDALETHDADLTISLENPHRRHLVAQPLWREIADYAVVPVQHPLARKRSVSVPELAALPLLINQGSFPPELVEGVRVALQDLGLRSPVVALDGDLQAVHLAVAAGRGWTVIVRSRALVPPPGTVAVRLEGMTFSIDQAAVWRRDDRRPVLRTVLDVVYEVARSYPESAVRAKPLVPAPPPSRKRQLRTPHVVPAALEVRHLRALLAVAATQTIGRGAERLGITQPTLSRQLQELEHVAGLTLLERSARGVRLTAAGVSLAGDIPPVLLAVERMVQAIVRAKRGMEGRCVIGMVATNVSTEIIGRTVAACAAKYPDLQLVISELATFRQPAALTRGDIDLGLSHAFPGTYPADGLTHTRVLKDSLNTALLPADHPLASRKRLKAQDLADLPFLFMARSFSPPFYDSLYGALAQLGLKPRVEAEYEALHAVWAMTGQGKGWSIGWESMRRTPPAGTVGRVIVGLNLPFGIDLLRRSVEHNPAVDVVAKELLNQRPRKHSH